VFKHSRDGQFEIALVGVPQFLVDPAPDMVARCVCYICRFRGRRVRECSIAAEIKAHLRRNTVNRAPWADSCRSLSPRCSRVAPCTASPIQVRSAACPAPFAWYSRARTTFGLSLLVRYKTVDSSRSRLLTDSIVRYTDAW